MKKFRWGLTIGLAAGYILGARAGEKRYEQLRKVGNVVANNPPIRRVIDDTKVLADEGTRRARVVLSDGLRQAGETVREKAG